MAEAPESESKPQSSTPHPIEAELQLELMRKRASWEQAHARRGTWRALSFLFLFVVLLGALLAYFYVMPKFTRPPAEKPELETSAQDR